MIPPHARKRLVGLFSISVAAIVLVRTAWMSDDAYITLRTVDNFINGYGLVYNVAERVQSYTHPLWLFLLAFLYSITHEAYYTPILLSLVLSLIVVIILAQRVATTQAAALFGTTAIIFSKAFVDYSTSGLENPLSHLIVILFLALYLTRKASLKNLFLLSILTALGTLNRLDLLLIFLPPLAFALVEVKAHASIDLKKTVFILISGLAPLLAWLIFSLFYYGFPLPNTAYAKLSNNIPQYLLCYQGLCYFLSSLNLDPLTLLVIGWGGATAVLSRSGRRIAVGAGVGLYLIYIIYIGGDFMNGRFFTVPFLCAVILLCTSTFIPNFKSLLLPLGVVLVVGFASPYPPIRSDGDYGQKRELFLDPRGVADERAFYYPTTGLLRACRDCRLPSHQWARDGLAQRSDGTPVKITHNIGMFGFYAGPRKHIVDVFGLADPLLSRLPIPDPYGWRIGHFQRQVPTGYEETLISGRNQIGNPALAEFYDAKRFVDIWKMNTGQYNFLLIRKNRP
jgi:arabinofuranosyltransferase